MLFDISGRIKPKDLDIVIQPLTRLLADQRIMEMTSITISFLGWRADGRAQIVDAAGFITSLYFDGERILDTGPGTTFVLPDEVSIRTCPDELDETLLAAAVGRDD